MQPRPGDLRKAMPKLQRAVDDQLSKARRFAMEQSVAHVLQRQKEQQIHGGSIFSGNMAQRQRIISLMCRIYVGSINFDIREETIKIAFFPFGPIRKVDISWDVPSVKHKGFAFVEYEVPDSSQLALEQMNNYLIGGRPIKIGRPSNVPQAAPMIESILEEARPYPRIFVANIHPQITCQDLRSIFESFGRIKTCDLIGEANTKHKGYAYIEYEAHKAANDAIMSMNMFDLGGQLLRVGKAVTLATYMNEDKGLPPAAALAMAAVSAKIKAADEKAAKALEVSTEAATSTTVSGEPELQTKSNSAASVNGQHVEGPVPPVAPQAVVQNGLGSNGVSIKTASPSSVKSLLPSSASDNKSGEHKRSSRGKDKRTKSEKKEVKSGEEAPTTTEPQPPPQTEAANEAVGQEESADKESRRRSRKHDHHREKDKNGRRSEKREKSEIFDELDYKKEENTIRGEEGVSIKGTNARFLMMRKLARNLVSSVLILRNMVEPSDVDDELKQDVEEECRKFGRVTSVIINQEKQGEDEGSPLVVKVFVKFADTKSAEKAQSVLNDRYFGGRSIKAEFYDENKFLNHDYSA